MARVIVACVVVIVGVRYFVGSCRRLQFSRGL
jgi:hypothetical protein